MKGLSEFVIAFCTVSIVIGGLYMLKPDSATEKSVKYVFSLIFICVIASALINIKFGSLEIPDNSSVATDTEISLAEMSLRLTFEEVLRNADINFSKISVYTDKKADGSIIINKVTVFSDDSVEKIVQLLGGNTAEYEIEVVYE
ncbi:MAG: hypothetical protein IKK24_00300 [Clostridia bacterium]|nr:hypothetical protein [Clostridia bacterium]